jgi:hypothetical protein
MKEEGQQYPKIAEKWGFGMAPPKLNTQRTRVKASEWLLHVLGSHNLPQSDDSCLELASILKGMFNRIVREDQWDWFTVAKQLGYPSRRISIGCRCDVALMYSLGAREFLMSQERAGFTYSQHEKSRICLRLA